MNNETQKFLKKLQEQKKVKGIILFGSWARGNNRVDSDVDLLVIVSDGYSREVEEYEGQLFEIIYTTKEDAIDYWKSDLDGCASLWRIGKIIYDKEGIMNELSEEVELILKAGKPVIKKKERDRLLFNAYDQLRAAKSFVNDNPSKAVFLINSTMFELTKTFFDLRQRYAPAPKQILEEIKEINNELYLKLIDFYSNKISLEVKLRLNNEIIDLIFKE